MSLKLKQSAELINRDIKRPNRNFNRISAFIFTLVLILLTAGCTSPVQDTSPLPTQDKLTIACTIPPQEEFIRQVGGDEVSILVMVPEGSSPHTFEPTPSQIRGLEEADLYIALGSGVEFENQWLERIHGMYPEMEIVNSSASLVLMPGGEDHHDTGEETEATAHTETGTDPHVWLSPQNVIKIVNSTAESLINIDPDNAGKYQENRNKYLQSLEELDKNIQASLSHLKSRTIIVYHPAFGYFCRDYNLTQLPIEADGQEPSARQLANLIDVAKQDRIEAIFIEPAFSSGNAETLAEAIGGVVVQINPLASDYLINMQTIAERIASHYD